MTRYGQRKSSPELISGPLRSTVFFLALPVLGEQVLNFLVGFYDVYLAGHLGADIRTDATAAVGVAAYVGWLASMFFAVVGNGKQHSPLGPGERKIMNRGIESRTVPFYSH